MKVLTLLTFCLVFLILCSAEDRFLGKRRRPRADEDDVEYQPCIPELGPVGKDRKGNVILGVVKDCPPTDEGDVEYQPCIPELGPVGKDKKGNVILGVVKDCP